MSILTKLKGYRTVLVNVAAAIGAISAAASGVDLNGDTAAAFVTGLAAINMVLRYFTTTSVFKKE